LTFRSRGLARSVAEELLQYEGDLLARIAAWWQDTRGQQPSAHIYDAATLLYGLTCAMWMTKRFSLRLRVRDSIFENDYTEGCPHSAGRWTRQPHDIFQRIALQLDTDLMPHGRFNLMPSLTCPPSWDSPNGSMSSTYAGWLHSYYPWFNCCIICSLLPHQISFMRWGR
jgi:hypothetical protein